MKKIIKFIILIIIITAAVYLLHPLIINSISFYPSRPMAYSGGHDYIHERMITTTDGISIHAYYLTGGTRHQKLLIYFHGNAGNNSHRIYDGIVFYKLGVDVLLVSYRGYGKSEGSPSEQGIYIDAESSYRYALNELGYRSTDIYVLGRSIGSTAAVDVARHKDLAGMILVTPLLSGADMARHMGLGLVTCLMDDIFNNRAKINYIQAPVLIIHGTSDRIVPYEQGRILYETFTGSKKLITIEGGDHNTLQARDPKAYWGAIEDFVK